jgi:hypothetical protein
MQIVTTLGQPLLGEKVVNEREHSGGYEKRRNSGGYEEREGVRRPLVVWSDEVHFLIRDDLGIKAH